MMVRYLGLTVRTCRVGKQTAIPGILQSLHFNLTRDIPKVVLLCQDTNDGYKLQIIRLLSCIKCDDYFWLSFTVAGFSYTQPQILSINMVEERRQAIQSGRRHYGPKILSSSTQPYFYMGPLLTTPTIVRVDERVIGSTGQPSQVFRVQGRSQRGGLEFLDRFRGHIAWGSRTRKPNGRCALICNKQ